LELTFHTAKLREVCEKRAAATAELGYAAARELSDRLADMEALDTVAELSRMFGKAILARSETEKALRLNSGFDVVFVSGHPLRPITEPTDWETITRMKIIAIEPVDV